MDQIEKDKDSKYARYVMHKQMNVSGVNTGSKDWSYIKFFDSDETLTKM